MNAHKDDLARMSARQLRARRRALAARLGDVQQVLAKGAHFHLRTRPQAVKLLGHLCPRSHDVSLVAHIKLAHESRYRRRRLRLWRRLRNRRPFRRDLWRQGCLWRDIDQDQER